MNKSLFLSASVALAMLAGPSLSAAHYLVTSTVDSIDSVPASGDGSQTTPYQMKSLRGAVIAVNSGGGGDTIHLPEGTFVLTISGAGEGFSGDAAKGDLDITASGTTLVGAGAGLTIIQQTTGDARVIEVNPDQLDDFEFTVEKITIAGGVTSFGGGGIVCGSKGNQTTVLSCVFDGNRTVGPASGGGALQSIGGGVLNVEDCTFRNNSTAVSSGGAIDILANPDPSSLSVLRSQFYNNSSANSGGAINVAGTISAASVISLCSFAGNTAANQGGAVAVAASPSVSGIGLEVDRCRLANNSATISNNGNDLTVSGLLPVTANQNWWGQNADPTDATIAEAVVVAPAEFAATSVTLTSWLQLGLIPGDTTVNPNGSTSLAADIRHLNMGGGPVDLTGLAPFPSTSATLFGSDALGSISADDDQFMSGEAAATFDAGATAGNAEVSVMIDGETVSITISIPTTVLSITRVDADPTSSSSASWLVTFADPLAGVNAGNFALAAVDLDGGPAISSVAPVGVVPDDEWIVSATTGSVSPGSCSGSLRLDMVSDIGITPVQVGNLTTPFEGESYTLFVPTVAGADTLGTHENVPVDAPIVKLLANDSGPTPLSITGVSPTSLHNGSVSIAGNLVHYIPPVNYFGPDEFTYELTDDCGSTATGVVMVTITAANAPSLNEVVITDLGGGQVRVVFAGIPDREYTIQSEPTIAGPWTDVVTLPAGANGLIIYVDTPAGGTAIYRTKAVAVPLP